MEYRKPDCAADDRLTEPRTAAVASAESRPQDVPADTIVQGRRAAGPAQPSNGP